MGEFASKGVAGIGLGLGIVDEGKVDLDRASAAAYAALEEAGGKVELSGYMVDKADIDALLEIAKKHAVE